MNELAASTGPLFNYGVLAIIVVVAFIAWFFVNRASVRASEQLQLLEALLEEQKKQNAKKSGFNKVAPFERIVRRRIGNCRKMQAERQRQKPVHA